MTEDEEKKVVDVKVLVDMAKTLDGMKRKVQELLKDKTKSKYSIKS